MASKPLAYNASLRRRVDHTKELTSFYVRYDEPLPQSPPFVPGQYVALGLNNEEKPELGSVRRSMSICSAPEETNDLEFYIRWVSHPESDNPLTHLLWDMKDGDRIFMTRKPVGKFTLEDTCGGDDGRIKLFVAAGTGLAPFVSMVRSLHLRDSKVDMSKLVLLHGASYPADLCYRQELEGYAEQHGLHYFKTVSRPNEAADWKGDVGRVEDYLKKDRLAELEQRLKVASGTLCAAKAAVLICGLQGTIAQTITRLAHRGFVPFDRKIRKALDVPESQSAAMWWEQYDTEPVVDLNNPDVVGSLKADLLPALANP
jgi:ferredoxin--NADP+ reductase